MKGYLLWNLSMTINTFIAEIHSLYEVDVYLSLNFHITRQHYPFHHFQGICWKMKFILTICDNQFQLHVCMSPVRKSWDGESTDPFMYKTVYLLHTKSCTRFRPLFQLQSKIFVIHYLFFLNIVISKSYKSYPEWIANTPKMVVNMGVNEGDTF